MVINKIDPLRGLPKLKVCVAYDLGGERITEFPANFADLEHCTPIYEEFDGFTEDITRLPHLRRAAPVGQGLHRGAGKDLRLPDHHAGRRPGARPGHLHPLTTVPPKSPNLRHTARSGRGRIRPRPIFCRVPFFSENPLTLSHLCVILKSIPYSKIAPPPGGAKRRSPTCPSKGRGIGVFLFVRRSFLSCNRLSGPSPGTLPSMCSA